MPGLGQKAFAPGSIHPAVLSTVGHNKFKPLYIIGGKTSLPTLHRVVRHAQRLADLFFYHPDFFALPVGYAVNTFFQ